MQVLAGAVILALLSGFGVAAAPESEARQAGQAAIDSTDGQSGTMVLGRAWPDDYGTTDLPAHMIAHYGLGTDDWRMANRAVYRIDPETRAVIAVIALITGDTFTIRAPAPAGYDIYNLPVAYRDRWQDGPNALYRYADGRIYRINPQTGRVAEAINIPAIPSS